MAPANFLRFATLLLIATFAYASLAAKHKDENSPPDGAPNATFETPMAAVQEQAVNALTVLGCEIKKQLPNFVEGKRVRKMGAFVGSGGETLRVWLADVDGKTTVKVSTDKTFVGGAGQKNWNAQMVEEITKGLVPTAAAAAAPATVPAPEGG